MLQLSLLGPFSLRTPGGVADIPYQRARALLAYLVLEPGPHRRDQLAELLWPEQAPATGRESLRRMVHLLRQGLGDAASQLASSRDTLGWEGSIDCDVLSLLSERPLCVHGCDPLARHRCIAGGQAQAELCRGPLLADIELDQCPEFEHWLNSRRNQVQQRQQALHQRLLRCCQQAGQEQDALHHARQLLALDPWDEATLAELLRLLLARGEVASAHHEYATFTTRLANELGSQPGPELAALYASLPASRSEPARAAQQPLAVIVARYLPAAATDQEAAWHALQAWAQRQSDRLQALGAKVGPLHSATLTAYFGLPQADEQDGRRAVAAALELGAADTALGVHAGWALLEPAADSVDLGGLLAASAQALAFACPAGEVRVSPSLAQAVRPAFYWADGADTSARPLHSRPQADSAPHHPAQADAPYWPSAPLHGRQNELAWLTEHWQQTLAGQGHSLLLTAPAGVGKSRLIRDWLAASGAPTLALTCRPEWAYSAFRPLQEASRQHGIELPPALRDAPPSLPDPQARQAQVSAWASAFLSWGGTGAAVLWVDDAHWLDPTSLEVLRAIAAQAQPPRLLLLTARPTADFAWPELCSTPLAPLPGNAMQALADDLCQQQPQALAPAQVEAAIARAAGIPLFLEALLQGGDGDSELPASLDTLLGSQIARLGACRATAEAAAILGSQFTPALLRPLLADTLANDQLLGSHLSQLEARGLLTPDPDQPGAYLFRHALLRDAVLAGLRRSRREQLHAQAAAALLAQQPQLAQEEPERLALHYREAGEYAAAMHWLTQAVARDTRRYAYHEAVHHGEAALSLLGQLPPGPAADAAELALRLHLGLPLMAVHGYGSAPVLATYARAHQLAGPLPDAPEFFPLLWGLWLVSSSTSHYRYSRDLAERLVRLANLRPLEQDPWCRAHAYYALGNSLVCLGELAAATVALEQALQLAPAHPTPSPYGEDPGVTAAAFLALARWCRGNPEAAREAADRSVARARQLQEPHSLAFALIFVAMVGMLAGEAERVRQSAEETRQLAAEHRLALWQVAAEVFLAWEQMRQGHHDSWGVLEHCVALSRTVMAGVESFFLTIASDACERANYPQVIPALARRGLELTQEKNDHLFEANFLRLLGLYAPTASERRKALSQSELRARQQGATAFLARLAPAS